MTTVKHQNVIVLNGKRYDAVSGRLLGESHEPVVPSGHRNVDGVVRARTKVVRPEPTPAKPAAKHIDVVAPKHHASSKHQTAKHAHAHHPEHTKTLMRRSVSRPDVTIKRAIKVQGPSEVAARPMSAIVPKRSAYRVDGRRLDSAKRTDKHGAIRHFLPYDHSVREIAMPQTAPLLTHAVPVVPVQSAPHHHPAPASHGHRPHTDIFDAAIARARSHEEPHHRYVRHPKRRRLANTMAMVGAFLVIGGFIAYLNMPNIELKVASFQAGFGAQIPGYKPTGFALRGGVQRQGSTVSLKYQSGDQSYTLTQQASNWDSRTLIENTLALAGAHETVQAAGRTVYIYDETSAVWVAGGVRYDLTGNAPLSTDEISALASSL